MAERRFRIPAAEIEQAAAIYTDAYNNDQFPTKAVADRMNVSRNQAAKLVSFARQRGLLPPTRGGVPIA